MNKKQYDVAIIGGGIVGLGTALALSEKKGISVIVLEAEEKLAAHQTGNNSGVIHSGLYYKPGSLKAKNCVEGRESLYKFCEEHNIPFDRCGKVVVATREDEIPALDELERRGNANGLKGLKRLRPEEIHHYEPHVFGIDGLYVAETGIVDYTAVTKKFAQIVQERGGEVLTSTRFLNLAKESQGFALETTKGQIRCSYLINCGGLQSDRIAKKCGIDPVSRIVPFRGEYYEIIAEKQHLVNNLIYPVPDSRFPFLGVHFTRMIQGGVEAGPNAVFALKREGYTKTSISITDTLDAISFAGFWSMVSKYWKMGLGEIYRSMSKRAFVKALRRLIPEITAADIHPAGAGVRAQALDPDGKLVDDFRILEAERMLHVLNAPSPAATASISIGRKIMAIAQKNFDL